MSQAGRGRGRGGGGAGDPAGAVHPHLVLKRRPGLDAIADRGS